MLYRISNVGYYESSNVDATTRQQRLATATDWLAKAMDGYLAVEDQRLIFDGGTRTRKDNRPRVLSYLSSNVTLQMLQSFYDIGSRSNDPKIRQILLPRLEKLKESSVKEVEKRLGGNRYDFGDLSPPEKTALADLDYVIAVFQGNTPAELPPNSKLKENNEPLATSDVKNQPAVKKETATKERANHKE